MRVTRSAKNAVLMGPLDREPRRKRKSGDSNEPKAKEAEDPKGKAKKSDEQKAKAKKSDDPKGKGKKPDDPKGKGKISDDPKGKAKKETGKSKKSKDGDDADDSGDGGGDPKGKVKKGTGKKAKPVTKMKSILRIGKKSDSDDDDDETSTESDDSKGKAKKSDDVKGNVKKGKKMAGKSKNSDDFKAEESADGNDGSIVLKDSGGGGSKGGKYDTIILKTWMGDILFKRKSNELKDVLESNFPDITVKRNPEPPLARQFEILDADGGTILALPVEEPPYPELQQFDLDKVVVLIKQARN